jgi:hypothetical protein
MHAALRRSGIFSSGWENENVRRLSVRQLQASRRSEPPRAYGALAMRAIQQFAGTVIARARAEPHLRCPRTALPRKPTFVTDRSCRDRSDDSNPTAGRCGGKRLREDSDASEPKQHFASGQSALLDGENLDLTVAQPDNAALLLYRSEPAL